MGDDEDLRINTLHRFAKHSPNLILEEYSHCEIPAGCGGVVLRWYDPANGHPVTIRVSLEGATADTWLDGAPLASSRAMLRPGAHALAVHLRRTGAGRVTFALHLAFDADEDRDVIAAGGPRYRLTTVAPPADWYAAANAAASWAAPAAGSLDDVDPSRRYWFEQAATLHAFDAPDAWLLVTFTSGAP